MSRSLRLSAMQLRAHDRASFEDASTELFEQVSSTARGCELLVLPEGTLPAYVIGTQPILAEQIERAIDRLRAIASSESCVIVCGAATMRDGKQFNSAIVIDRDGSVAGITDKTFLWAFDRKWFTANQRIGPIDTSIGRLGVMICADGRMPGIARTLVDQGADLLVMPTAWVTSGRDPAALENLQADLLARVRAFENGVPFIAANKCGVELGMVLYCGKSQIVGADGSILAMASQHEPETITTTVRLGEGLPERTAFDPPAQAPVPAGVERLAFSLDAPPSDLQERLNILDAGRFAGPGDGAALEARLAFDPGFLPAYRQAGMRFVTLDAPETHPWLEPIARARASELRMYVLVFDRARDRAYLVDPDGAIIAGTTGQFRIATGVVDYARTANTMVAPGTDVAAGLALVDALSKPPVQA